MFARLFTIASVAALALAGAIPSTTPASQCNTGGLQCCNNVQSATSANAANPEWDLVSKVVGLAGNVGTSCTPITAIGLGSGSSCTAQPVCCTGNTFNGLVNIGCTPVNLGL
ncbi:fungal hydrophobin [Paxillus involutus ATCC 200175]|uniref:Hydrophobin n=2 Tax=Paxillus involutus TaxID=71150 RepID=A0A0C9TE05_PAXIN|nr:fungal hydrophobin [Paxillus involutus ATCC 200175]